MDGLREEMQGHVVVSVVSIMRAVSLSLSLLDRSIGLQFKAGLESVKQRRRQTQTELLTGFGPDVQTTSLNLQTNPTGLSLFLFLLSLQITAIHTNLKSEWVQPLLLLVFFQCLRLPRLLCWLAVRAWTRAFSRQAYKINHTYIKHTNSV